jgi:UDP-N-acetyl-D-glucosamine dehydrogenase
VVADFTHPQPVAVLGLGTVGWPVAQAVAAAGHPVLGFDIDTGQVAALRRELAEHPPAGQLHLVTQPAALAAAGTYLICAPTDLSDGRPELSAVLAALDLIAGLLRPGDLVAVESTLPPGATAQLLAPRLAGRSGLTPGTDFALVYAPERLDPGNAHFGVRNTPKLLGGLTPACTEVGRTFYETVVGTVTAVTAAEAELAKLLENSFRQVNVALVNELTMLCAATGVDVHTVLDAAASKPFGFMPFRAGPGTGGRCIPLATEYLVAAQRSAGLTPRLTQAAMTVNQAMPDFVVRRLDQLLAGQGRRSPGAGIGRRLGIQVECGRRPELERRGVGPVAIAGESHRAWLRRTGSGLRGGRPAAGHAGPAVRGARADGRSDSAYPPSGPRRGGVDPSGSDSAGHPRHLESDGRQRPPTVTVARPQTRHQRASRQAGLSVAHLASWKARP